MHDINALFFVDENVVDALTSLCSTLCPVSANGTSLYGHGMVDQKVRKQDDHLPLALLTGGNDSTAVDGFYSATVTVKKPARRFWRAGC
jgi:hypothetical protein